MAWDGLNGSMRRGRPGFHHSLLPMLRKYNVLSHLCPLKRSTANGFARVQKTGLADFKPAAPSVAKQGLAIRRSAIRLFRCRSPKDEVANCVNSIE